MADSNWCQPGLSETFTHHLLSLPVRSRMVLLQAATAISHKSRGTFQAEVPGDPDVHLLTQGTRVLMQCASA